MKSTEYKSVIDYAKKNNIRFACINEPTEIDTATEFNGLSAIDTKTFETPCCFSVERGLAVCLSTPADMTPDDTGESYAVYDKVRTELSEFRPQYIVPDEGGCYIKLMVWCDWEGSGATIDEFKEACREAVGKVSETFKDPVLDFRVFKDGDPTPDIYSISEIGDMVKDREGKEFDAELYIDIEGSAYPTDHGVKAEFEDGFITIKAY